MKILLVDDDTEIVQLISRRLKQDNYVVEVATDGQYAVDLAQASTYGLILLDLMLPKLNGIEVCETLRNTGDDTPVLMLTGEDGTSTKVTGLDAGADDYLVKPFELDELTARVRALLRRNSATASTLLSYGPLQFDPSNQILSCFENQLLLRPKELAILELLLRYPTRVFSTDVMLDRLWDLAECPGKATVKAHIGSLRKRLAQAGAKDVIETVYGRGYRLNPLFLKNCDRAAAPQPAAEPTSTTQTVIEDTWEQVQSMAWHRFTRLETLMNDQLPVAGEQPESRHETCKAAVAIAHQLKGTLGSFGFQTASLQAKHIEALLSTNSLQDNVAVALLQQQIATLKQLLQQHITAPGLPLAGLPSLDPARVLVAARDRPWAETLMHHGQDGPFQIEACSPLTINDHLLEHTPDVILLELSQSERALDLSLLDVLASNYGEQVPILVALESLCPDEQLVVIHHGASAVVVKSWATKTLLAMITEYIPLAPSVTAGIN